MPGGIGRPNHRQRLGDRVDGGQPADPVMQLSPARHCFVDDQPSLLVEWRRTTAGWEGRVISVLWIDAVGWTTVERWLPATAITSSRWREP